MLGLHMVLNKFSIIDIWHGSEYASCYEYASVTQSSVENAPSYIFDRDSKYVIVTKSSE